MPTYDEIVINALQHYKKQHSIKPLEVSEPVSSSEEPVSEQKVELENQQSIVQIQSDESKYNYVATNVENTSQPEILVKSTSSEQLLPPKKRKRGRPRKRLMEEVQNALQQETQDNQQTSST